MRMPRLGALLVLLCATLLATQPAFAQFSQQGPKLVGAGAVGNATQGTSVSISADGNTAIVGGFGDNGGIGAAWIWTRSGGVWSQQGTKLVGSGGVGQTVQGVSVAISADGNTAIVGGYGDENKDGAAWVFTRSGGVWTQQGAKLVGSGAIGKPHQSYVALSNDGNTAIVGGPGDNGEIGAAWVWTRSGGVWTQQGAKLVGSGTHQGSAVSLSADGNTAAIGGSGIWVRSGGVWTKQSSITGVLSDDGNTLIAGNPYEDGDRGAARVWTRSGAVWTQQGPKLVGSGAVSFTGPSATYYSLQGSSVSLSADGNTAAVGGVGDDANAGAVWVWTRSGGVWTQQGTKLVGSGVVGKADQGGSVSLAGDGNTIIVGGQSDNQSAGAAWIFAAPDLTITKSHVGNFHQGDTGDTYTITVTNSGPVATSGTVTVTDIVPSALTPTAPNGVTGGWNCSIAGQTLTCTRSDVLAPSTSYPPITLTVDVPNSAGASVTNTATVSGGGNVSNPNDTASDVTTIEGIANLAITKSINGSPLFPAGGNLTYTITVANSGSGTAGNVVVTDTLPGGTTFVSATPSQGSCSGTTTVSCSLGTLLNGGSATISLVLTTASTPGQVVNTATVTATQVDPNSANNSATATVSTVDPSSIPAASEWVLIALAGVLAMLGAMRIRS